MKIISANSTLHFRKCTTISPSSVLNGYYDYASNSVQSWNGWKYYTFDVSNKNAVQITAAKYAPSTSANYCLYLGFSNGKQVWREIYASPQTPEDVVKVIDVSGMDTLIINAYPSQSTPVQCSISQEHFAELTYLTGTDNIGKYAKTSSGTVSLASSAAFLCVVYDVSTLSSVVVQSIGKSVNGVKMYIGTNGGSVVSSGDFSSDSNTPYKVTVDVSQMDTLYVNIFDESYPMVGY